MSEVILVDEHDNEIGIAEKLDAHKTAKLHRAFSIFVFNTQGQLLIQKRAKTKYHSAGLWSNTCCGHPSPGEETVAGAHRRLKEEMGFDCDLKEGGTLLYKTSFENGLTEHEYDYICIGRYDGAIHPEPNEVDEWKWKEPGALIKDMKENPANYTYWLKLSFQDVLEKIRQ